MQNAASPTDAGLPEVPFDKNHLARRAGARRGLSFNVIHHASHPAVAGRLPYVGALIVFPELPGVRLVSNVTDCAPSTVAIGMTVEVWWDDIGDGQFVPRFRPAKGHVA